jgi:peroxiredoxin
MTKKRTSESRGSAGRIAPGDTVTARELTTIQSERILLPAPGILTHLQFRRYAGCPICNLHLQSMARHHDEIVAAGIQEIVLFHSAAEDMLPYQGQLPFAAVADPGRKLYNEFGVTASPRAVLHPKAWTSPVNPRVYPMILRGIRAGGSPAPWHGDTALGLPADFLIEPDGRVRAAKYGRHASDHWSVDELLQLALTPPAATTPHRATPEPCPALQPGIPRCRFKRQSDPGRRSGKRR